MKLIETEILQDERMISYHAETHVGVISFDDFEQWIKDERKDYFMHERQSDDQSDVIQKEYRMSFDEIMSDMDLRDRLITEYLEQKNQ